MMDLFQKSVMVSPDYSHRAHYGQRARMINYDEQILSILQNSAVL